MGQSRETGDVCDVAGRIANTLAEDRACIVIDELRDVTAVVAFGKENTDTDAREMMREKAMRRAV